MLMILCLVQFVVKSLLVSFLRLHGLVVSGCGIVLYLLRLSTAIIRFGDRSRFLICGVLSRNLALVANSIILFIVCSILDVNSSFIFMVCFRNIFLLSVLKYLHLYIICGRMSQGSLIPMMGHILSLLLYSSHKIDYMSICQVTFGIVVVK